MSTDIQELNRLIKENLHIDNYDKSKGWMISKSKLSGRGVFATKDFQPGEIILKDTPLITGPRAGINAKIHCVICMRNHNLRACSRGCGLPMCSLDCEKNLNHSKECEFITNRSVGVKFTEVSYALFRALTPIRALLMEDLQLKLLLQLANHDDEQHGFEVGLIKSKIQLKDDEAVILKKICCALDANAFETMVDTKECFDDLCLRGLYPIASLLNHNCAPNTTHLFDENQTMIIKATVPITRCTEIFTSYTTMLWATAARRHHLQQTKHFECNCKRCEDPREFGACLSALRCTNPKNCDGALYPLDPLYEEEKWQCAKCKFKISKSSMAIIQSALGSLLTTVDVTEPVQLMDLLQKRIHEVVPITNHIVVELKCRVIWMIGRAKGHLWHEVPIETLQYKEKITREILKLIQTLGLGQCKLKGLLLCELSKTITEINKRHVILEKEKEKQEEAEKCLAEATEILFEDYRAPLIVKLYLEDTTHKIFKP